MEFKLSPKVEQMVRDRVASGEFSSESELIETAVIRLMLREERLPPEVEEIHRRELAKAVAEEEAGLAKEWDVTELIDSKRRRKGA